MSKTAQQKDTRKAQKTSSVKTPKQVQSQPSVKTPKKNETLIARGASQEVTLSAPVNERTHKAIIVEVGARREEIDLKLAPLIRELWTADIDTFMSCEEVEPGIAWIEFTTVANLIDFLNIVAKYEKGADTLYNRINDQLSGNLSFPAWVYTVDLWDCGFSPFEEDVYEGPADFTVGVSVYFPQADLPTLLRRMRKHNKSRSSQPGNEFSAN